MPSENAPIPAALVHTVDTETPAMNSILARIVAYLAEHRALRSIDPVDIPPELLPHLFVLAIERAGPDPAPRLRVRLTGTALDNAFGRCVKGQCLEEFLHGSHSAAVLAGFRSCAEPGSALWMRQVVTITNRSPRYVEGVALHVEPDRIYGGLLFGEVADRRAGSSFESRKL